ncbi:MAG: hypothetical protein RIB98_12805 [Acidimicrobiales bacterium]
MSELHTSRRLRIFPLLAILLAVSLVAAACGDDGDSADPDTTVPADEGTETDADDADTTDDTAGDDDTGDDSGEMSGDADSTYCELSTAQNAIDAEFNPFDVDAAGMEAYFVDNRDRLAEAVDVAPSEIRDDLQAILTAFDEQFIPTLAAADWDFFAVSDELEAISENAALDEAQMRLEAYDADVCGIGGGVFDGVDETGAGAADDALEDALGEFLGTPEGLETVLESEFGRDAFIAGMTADGRLTTEQAECMLTALDIDMLLAFGALVQQGADATSSDDLAALGSALDGCGISADQFS